MSIVLAAIVTTLSPVVLLGAASESHGPAQASTSAPTVCEQALTSSNLGIGVAGQSGATTSDCADAADGHELALLPEWGATWAAEFADVLEDSCVSSLQGVPEEHVSFSVAAEYCD